MRATGVGRSLGHTTLCGASFRATSLGTKVHAGPPSDPGWVASTTLPQCSLTDRTPVPPLPSPGPCRKAEAAHPVVFIESVIRGRETCRSDHQWLTWGCGLGKSKSCQPPPGHSGQQDPPLPTGSAANQGQESQVPQARALSTSPLVRPQAGRAGREWAEPGKLEGVQPPGTKGSALAVLVGVWEVRSRGLARFGSPRGRSDRRG